MSASSNYILILHGLSTFLSFLHGFFAYCKNVVLQIVARIFRRTICRFCIALVFAVGLCGNYVEAVILRAAKNLRLCKLLLTEILRYRAG